jgi:hypothetical protein
MQCEICKWKPLLNSTDNTKKIMNKKSKLKEVVRQHLEDLNFFVGQKKKSFEPFDGKLEPKSNIPCDNKEPHN